MSASDGAQQAQQILSDLMKRHGVDPKSITGSIIKEIIDLIEKEADQQQQAQKQADYDRAMKGL